MSITPKQIGDVVGVDRMDTLDRQRLDPRWKLQLLAEETKAVHGRDPRGGGMSFVGRPRVVLQLLLDLAGKGSLDVLRLERMVVVGADGGDVVAFWQDVKIVVRGCVVDDRLHCCLDSSIPESKMIDRKRAAEIRINAHRGTLESLRED